MIEFKCENCGRKLSVEEEHAGKKAKCPDCGTSFVIPQKGVAEDTREVPAKPGPPVPDAGGTTAGAKVQAGQGGIPAEIRGWNWGAFLLTWIWAIGNRVWLGLLCLIPYVGFVMAFVLGAKGNEWAWQTGRFESVEEFKRVQRTWRNWGLGILAFAMAIMVVGLLLQVR